MGKRTGSRDEAASLPGIAQERRKLFLRTLGLAAALGITKLLTVEDGGLLPSVHAAPNPLYVDQVATGTGTTELGSTPAGTSVFRGRNTSAAAGSVGIEGIADAVLGRGVAGTANSTAGNSLGVLGQSYSTSGNGVFGRAYATSGPAIGVAGQSDSADGVGVQGYASSPTGPANGVYGQTASTSGVGVEGMATATSGITAGVFGSCASISGSGVGGIATASTGLTAGVNGRSNSTSGVGVYGYAAASGGTGVSGVAGNAGAIPMLAQGAANQTADLHQWQNSSGWALVRIDANGNLVLASGGKIGVGIQPSAAFHIKAPIPIFKFTGTSLPNNEWHFGRFDVANRFTIAESGVDDWLTISGGSGNVGVGNIDPAEKLDVNGNVRCVSLIQTSDMRFKEDIAPIPNALVRLEQVRGVTFEWNKRYECFTKTNPGRQIGLIAQEVEEAFPELVNKASLEDVKDARGVDYARFTAVLVEAVKELHRQNKDKIREIAELRTRLEKLEQANLSLDN